MLLHIHCQLKKHAFSVVATTCHIYLLKSKYVTYCASYFGLYFKAYFFQNIGVYVLVTVGNQCAINMSK